jgi:hypothetical protein
VGILSSNVLPQTSKHGREESPISSVEQREADGACIYQAKISENVQALTLLWAGHAQDVDRNFRPIHIEWCFCVCARVDCVSQCQEPNQIASSVLTWLQATLLLNEVAPNFPDELVEEMDSLLQRFGVNNARRITNVDCQQSMHDLNRLCLDV